MKTWIVSSWRAGGWPARSRIAAPVGPADAYIEERLGSRTAAIRSIWKRTGPSRIITLLLLLLVLASLLSPSLALADGWQANGQAQVSPESPFALSLRVIGAIAAVVCCVLAGIALIALALILHQMNRRSKPAPTPAPDARTQKMARHPTVVSAVGWGKLTVAGGPAQARSLDLIHPSLTIGRSASNDLMLPDNRVSRQHALIEQRAGGAVVTDLGSSNGTFVNGEQVQSSYPLQAGATIRVGNTELVFHPAGGSHVPAPARRTPVRTGSQPRRLTLEGDAAVLTIGRGLDCDVVLADRYVSRHHARISSLPMVTLLQDLGSTHGTFVNGQRISQPTPLRPGDVIRIGNSELVI